DAPGLLPPLELPHIDRARGGRPDSDAFVLEQIPGLVGRASPPEIGGERQPPRIGTAPSSARAPCRGRETPRGGCRRRSPPPRCRRGGCRPGPRLPPSDDVR